jgi:hypothetical protein
MSFGDFWWAVACHPELTLGGADNDLDYLQEAAIENGRGNDRCITSAMKALGYCCRGTGTVWIDELHRHG